MNRKILSLVTVVLISGISFSQEKKEKEIEEVIILKTPTQPTKRIDDKLYTGTEITTKGIETMGVIANSNVFSILNIIPSVTTTTTDESDGEHGHGDFVEQRIVVACFDLIVHVAVL